MLQADDHEAANRLLASRIDAVVKRNPRACLLIATGNTPMRAYAILAAMAARGELDMSGVTVFQLDEYVGVATDDPRSLFGWMKREFSTPLGIHNVARLNGCSADLEGVCRSHDDAIEAAGGIDLCVLGLGPNGHVGFNEPPSPPDAPTREVKLTPESLVSNAVYFKDAVPARALTTGMAQILAAREIILVATGARKREILHRTLHGPVAPDLPASQLKLAKGEVCVIADRAALGGEA